MFRKTRQAEKIGWRSGTDRRDRVTGQADKTWRWDRQTTGWRDRQTRQCDRRGRHDWVVVQADETG